MRLFRFRSLRLKRSPQRRVVLRRLLPRKSQQFCFEPRQNVSRRSLRQFERKRHALHKISTFRKDEFKRILFQKRGSGDFNYLEACSMTYVWTFLRREFAVLVTTYQTLPYSSEVEFAFLFCYWALQNKCFQTAPLVAIFIYPLTIFAVVIWTVCQSKASEWEQFFEQSCHNK